MYGSPPSTDVTSPPSAKWWTIGQMDVHEIGAAYGWEKRDAHHAAPLRHEGGQARAEDHRGGARHDDIGAAPRVDRARAAGAPSVGKSGRYGSDVGGGAAGSKE